jgi:hypothetical protein
MYNRPAHTTSVGIGPATTNSMRMYCIVDAFSTVPEAIQDMTYNYIPARSSDLW